MRKRIFEVFRRLLLYSVYIHCVDTALYMGRLCCGLLFSLLFLTQTRCHRFDTQVQWCCMVGVVSSLAQCEGLYKLGTCTLMGLRNSVVAEDISPKVNPPHMYTPAHTHHEFVATGLTFFEAAYLSSTCCVVFVRSSESWTCGECPIEPINGLENMLLMLFTVWQSLTADESALHPDTLVALSLSPLSVSVALMKVKSSNAFTASVSLTLPVYHHDCFACISSSCSQRFSVCPSLLATVDSSNTNFHLNKMTPSLNSCFLTRRGGLTGWSQNITWHVGPCYSWSVTNEIEIQIKAEQ